MRNFMTFKEANSEIRRDLGEMGVRVVTTTFQDKVIAGQEERTTLELQNYVYTVLSPQLDDLQATQPWADIEFSERVGGTANPGRAWETRADIWHEFLHNGRFSYTYSERLNTKGILEKVIKNIKADRYSRQHYVSIWRPEDVKSALGYERIPCSLGYLFQVRNEKLHITYFQRSADFVVHFQNDQYLAHRLQQYVSERTGIPHGRFTHFVASLHVYKKDVDEVF